MQLAKQSTAANLIAGPILDSAGAEYTGAVIGDLSIAKNDATTLTTLASAATLTHLANGIYSLVLTTGNTDTLGRCKIVCNKSTYQMPPIELEILNAPTFDTIVTNGTLASMTSGRTLAVDAAGAVTLADAVAHGGTIGSSTATLALSRLAVLSQTANTAAATFLGNGSGSGVLFNGGNAATSTAAGHGAVFTGGSASTVSGGIAGTGLLAQGGAGAGSTNGAGDGSLFTGGSTTTVSGGRGLVLTGTSAAAGLAANVVSVSGTTTLSGAVSLGSTLTVTGTTSLAAVSTSGTVTLSALTVTNNVLVSGTWTTTGTTTLTGAVSLGSTLTVTGTTTLAALAMTTFACTTLTASGAVAFQSTFAVTGTTTLTGNVSLGGTLGVTGTVTFNAFTVTNNLLVSGTATVTGATTFTGAITGTNASNDLRINGAVPGAANGLFIAGTNAATTVTTSFTTTFTGNLTGTTGGMTAAGWAQAFTVNTTKVYSDAVAGSVVSEIAVNAGSGGTADWTSTERSQIRYRLGIDGATAIPVASPTIIVSGIAGTTQTLDALQTALSSAHGSGSWATATSVTVSDKTGFSLANGSFVTATLGTFALAKTTNITGFNDIAATAVVSGGAITTSGGAVSTVTTTGTVTTVSDKTGYALTSGERDSIAAALLDLAAGVETSVTVRKALRAIAAFAAGKRSNSGTATESYDALGNPGTARIVGNLDSSGDGTPTLTL